VSKVVAVWHSDPEYGDPYEGVFYMKPPYTREQFAQMAYQMGVRWTKSKADGGLVMTAKPKVIGPLPYEDTRRHDLSENHREDDEFVLVGWFKRDKPLLLTTDEIERRRELALRYGYTPNVPVLTGSSDPTSGLAATVADEMGEYRDPAGLDEQGYTAEDRKALYPEED
jgi:hypothetical protein